MALGAALALAAPGAMAAQVVDARPIVLGNGRLTLGGAATATFGCAAGSSVQGCGDDTGFFNYTDYELSTLRMLRLDVSAELRANDRLALLADLRSDNGQAPEPYALFVRVRPWPARRFDIQAGRIPPTFGAFARRTYPSDNLLIGYPLGYQYLTSLRSDALPANADELLRMRGRGWLSSFGVGNPAPDSGVPLVSAFRWDTGVQVHGATDVVDAAVAVTTGTLSHPLVNEDNDGKQVAGRIAVQPFAGLIVGASGARGPYVGREAAAAAGVDAGRRGLTQTAWGADAEYSRDHYLVRAEAIASDWRLPIVGAPVVAARLRAVSTSVEGRYRFRPGLYAAARLDHLAFSTITGTSRQDEWDAPVTRLEIGGGYSLMRNLVLKLAWQRNTRDTTRAPSRTFVAAQAAFWF